MDVEKIINDSKVKHDSLQIGLGVNNICIREGIVLNIQEECRFGFEFFCYRSPEMIYEMDMFVKYAKGRKCLLDCGAFDGIYSLVFAAMNPNSKVYAIEPSHEPNCRLRSNTHNAGNIEVHKAALSFYDGEINMGTEWEHLVENSEGEYCIPCFKGDTLCKDEPPDTIKIDCEGMELKVLTGLGLTIINNKPLIFLELHVGRLLEEWSAVIAQFKSLKNLGYKVIDSLTDQEYILEETPTDLQDKRLIFIP